MSGARGGFRIARRGMARVEQFNGYGALSNKNMALNDSAARCLKTGCFLLCIWIWYSTQAGAQSRGTAVQIASMDASSVASSSELPDAPSPALSGPQETSSSPVQTAAAESDEGRQTKRILGIVPNFRSVSVNTHLPPQSPKEKFVDFAHDSFDYSSFIFVGMLSAVSQIEGSTPEFHTGPPAYARYYWHTFADQTDENLWVEFLLPVAFRQDARYYTLGSGTADKHNGFIKRAGYAFSRILVTRTDSGGSSFNFSEVIGAGASSGISNLYYPASDRTWTKTGQRWALSVGIDGSTFIFREFWPDINHAIFHRK